MVSLSNRRAAAARGGDVSEDLPGAVLRTVAGGVSNGIGTGFIRMSGAGKSRPAKLYRFTRHAQRPIPFICTECVDEPEMEPRAEPFFLLYRHHFRQNFR